MEKRKKLITILSAAIMVTAIFAPLLFVKTVAAQDPTGWYRTVSGVLDSDKYVLYPYASRSLRMTATLKLAYASMRLCITVRVLK